MIRSACQFQGSSRSSSVTLVRPATMRSSTSVSQAKGSTPLSFAVATRLATIAQWWAPPSDPANKAFLRPKAIGRIARSMVLVCVPWQGALLSLVEAQAGKLSLQPEALGADQEATNGLEHLEKRPRKGGQRTVRAAT